MNRFGGTAGATAGNHKRLFGLVYQIDCALERRVGGFGVRRLCPGRSIVVARPGTDSFTQYVGGNLDHDRAGIAVCAVCTGDGCLEFVDDIVGVDERARVTRDRTHQVDLGQFLQSALADLWPRRTSGDDQYRNPADVSVGDGSYGIGQPGAGSNQRDAKFAGQFTVGVGHVYGGAFVPGVDQRDRKLCRGIPNRNNMSAEQSENPINILGAQKLGDHAGYGLLTNSRRAGAFLDLVHLDILARGGFSDTYELFRVYLPETDRKVRGLSLGMNVNELLRGIRRLAKSRGESVRVLEPRGKGSHALLFLESDSKLYV